MQSVIQNSPFYGISDVHLITLMRGLELMNSGKIRSGYEIFDQLSLLNDPKLSSLMEEYKRMGILLQSKSNLKSANELAKTGEYRKALKQFERVELSLCPLEVVHQCHNNKGVCYAHLTMFDKALVEFELALKVRPDNTRTVQNKAILLMMMGEYYLAIESLQGLLAARELNTDLNVPLLLFFKFECLHHLYKLSEARECAQKCLEVDGQFKIRNQPGLSADMKIELEKFILSGRVSFRDLYQIRYFPPLQTSEESAVEMFTSPGSKRSAEIRQTLQRAAIGFECTMSKTATEGGGLQNASHGAPESWEVPKSREQVECDVSTVTPMPEHYPVRWRKEGNNRRHTHFAAPPTAAPAATNDVSKKFSAFSVGSNDDVIAAHKEGPPPPSSSSDDDDNYSVSSISSITDPTKNDLLISAAARKLMTGQLTQYVAVNPVMLSRRYKIGQGLLSAAKSDAVSLPEPSSNHCTALPHGENMEPHRSQCDDAATVKELERATTVASEMETAKENSNQEIVNDRSEVNAKTTPVLPTTSTAEVVVDQPSKRVSSIPRINHTAKATRVPTNRDTRYPEDSVIGRAAASESVDKEPVAGLVMSTLRPVGAPLSSRIPTAVKTHASHSSSLQSSSLEDPARMYERSRSQLRSVSLHDVSSELSIDLTREVLFSANMLKHTDSPYLKSASEEARVTVPHWCNVECEIPSLPATPRATTRETSEVPHYYYSLTELRTAPYPSGVAVGNREYYLQDAVFLEVMGMNKDSWSRVPQWKKMVIKKRVGLF